MNIDLLLMACVGFEDDGEHVRFYLDSPTPQLSFERDRGVRTSLFRLFGGHDAQQFREYLALHRYRCWDVLRVPPEYTPERGAAAVRIAGCWHSGRHSPLFLVAATRRIRDEEHREQLRRAVGFPKPKQDGGRPHYSCDLIQKCLDIRRTGIGANGRVVLFNRRPEKKAARPVTVSPPAEYPELVESLKALGLQMAGVVVGSAVEAVFPDGTGGVEHGELVRRVFLHLQARRV